MRLSGPPRDVGAAAGQPVAHDEPAAYRPTIVRWPLDMEPGFERMALRDSWASLVRDSMVAYREGRTDVAGWSWSRTIEWRIKANGMRDKLVGAEAIFAYHRRLALLSGDTFRQRVISLDSSHGPIVEASLHSTGRRAGRRLDMPTLVVFELSGSRIQTVTELPGDPAAWHAFWAAE